MISSSTSKASALAPPPPRRASASLPRRPSWWRARHSLGGHAVNGRQPRRSTAAQTRSRTSGGAVSSHRGDLVLEGFSDQPLHDEERIADHRRIGAELEHARHRRPVFPCAHRTENRVLGSHVVRQAGGPLPKAACAGCGRDPRADRSRWNDRSRVGPRGGSPRRPRGTAGAPESFARDRAPRCYPRTAFTVSASRRTPSSISAGDSAQNGRRRKRSPPPSGKNARPSARFRPRFAASRADGGRRHALGQRQRDEEAAVGARGHGVGHVACRARARHASSRGA